MQFNTTSAENMVTGVNWSGRMRVAFSVKQPAYVHERCAAERADGVVSCAEVGRPALDWAAAVSLHEAVEGYSCKPAAAFVAFVATVADEAPLPITTVTAPGLGSIVGSEMD